MTPVPSIAVRSHQIRRCQSLVVAVLAASCSSLAADGDGVPAPVPSADSAVPSIAIPAYAAAPALPDASFGLSVDGGGAPLGPPPPSCTSSTSTLLPRPAEALLVQDQSTAMAETLPSGASKWAASVSAIAQAAASGSAAWGLMLFPKVSADGACCAMPTDDLEPEVEVAPDVQSGSAIGATFARSSATGTGRPLARAVVQAGNHLGARPTSTSKYVVLVVAGEPTCANDGLCSDADTADDARSKEAVTHVASLLGIPVVVAAVGLPAASNSFQTGRAQQFFTDLAKLGGMPNTSQSQPAYYAAASSSELAAALASIASRMRSCSFALASPPTSTRDAQVTLAGARVPQDVTHQNGWDFADGGTSIALYGKPCADVRSAASTTPIQFTTLCPLAVY
jgi:hypothetical protein